MVGLNWGEKRVMIKPTRYRLETTFNSLLLKIRSGNSTLRNGMFCEVEEKLSTREDIYAMAKRILVYGVVELNIFPPRLLP